MFVSLVPYILLYSFLFFWFQFFIIVCMAACFVCFCLILIIIYFYCYFLVIKPTRCTNFTNLFVMKLYTFQTVPLSIIRSLFTVHSAMVYVIHVCRQLSSRSRMELQFCPGPAECIVNKLLMMDRRTVRNM